MEKRCSKCGKVKSVTEFYKETASPDGLFRWCKTCARIYQKVYYKRHREELVAKQKVYDKEHREKIAAQRKVYRDKHRKKLAIYARAHYKEHREELVAKQRVYQEGHPEQYRMYVAQRRAREASASGHVTIEQIQARWEYYGNKCYICGKDAEATDHVIPLSKGGSNWPANLRPICKRCNNSKHAKWPYDFEEARQEMEA